MTSQNMLNKTHGNEAMATTDNPALLKRPQLARAINTSTRTVDNLQRKRIIPCIRLSRRCIRFDLSAVLHALKKLEVKAVGE